MKKLTDKDAILCVSIEEAIAIRDNFGLKFSDDWISWFFKENHKLYVTARFHVTREDYESFSDYKITKASKILNKGVSKKELLRRIEKLEKVMIDNTEVTVSKTPEIEGIKNEIPKITEVQVDCSELTKEQIQELADIVVDNDCKISGLKDCFKIVREDECFFRQNTSTLNFAVFDNDENLKTITYQQFKEFYSKEKPDLGSTDTSLSIREVQVKVNSQEEADECAEIVKAWGDKIWKSNFSLSILNTEIGNLFRYDDELKGFGVFIKDVSKTEISIQEFRERFGKPKEIDWSVKFQYVENEEGKWAVLEDVSEKYFYGCLVECVIPNQFLFAPTEVFKEGKTLCTEPITLSN